MGTQTILEPLALDGDGGAINDGFDDSTPVVTSEKEEIFHKPKEVPKLWKWRLEGMTLVVLSVIILSAALTLALLINIIVGDPQVKPHGSVVAENDFCASIGLEVMEKQGGNAVDAAVSTALCMAVVRPDVASLAGCGFMLIRDRNLQSSHLFDFMCAAPSNPPQPNVNKSETLVGIPGFIRGLHKAHIRFGKKNWEQLFVGSLEALSNGFRPDPALLRAAKLKKGSSNKSASIVDGLLAAASGMYLPPSILATTYRHLATAKPAYFVDGANEVGSLDNSLLEYMKTKGQHWTKEDFISYSVHEPTPLEVEFSGFTVESFPAPVSGGPFLLSLLGNLDLLNSLRPLSSSALMKKDPEETSILLHRLIELSKFAEHSASELGDLTDPTSRDMALKAQNKMFSVAERQTIVRAVNDSHTLSSNLSEYRLHETHLGDTGIVVTDSVRLTVVINLFLGSPFGTGEMIPNTGVHLNAAMRLFDPPVTASNKSSLNSIATGRRPLFPVAPVYITTTHRKCGVRFGLTSSGGIWGTSDVAQVITSASLFLRGATCYLPSSMSPPAANVESGQLVASKSIETKTQPRKFTPAVDHGCLNIQLATDLPRFHLDMLTHSDKNKTLALLVEPQFEKALVEQLRRLGHDIRNETGLWLGRVVSAGWNGYDMITSLDNRGSWNLHSF